MAKQLGIHQIKGKVGERSYYRTKGVELGISRSINQGLSARVKNGDEYANTRLNNAEFKNANAIASAAFKSVNSRKRGMMRNFAIAAMTKAALEDIKQGVGDWGARRPATEMDALICNLLENHAKGGSYDGQYGVVTSVDLTSSGSFTAQFELSEEIETALAALGINGLYFIPSKCLAGEVLVDDTPRLFAGSAVGVPVQENITAGSDATVTLSGTVATAASVGMSQSGYAFAQDDTKHGFYLCVSIMPYRTESGTRYVLQEYCTYVAIPLGQIPEP